MFEINKVYWFKIKGEKKDFVNLKGKVIEENGFMVKIEQDSGKISILSFNQLLGVNEERIIQKV